MIVLGINFREFVFTYDALCSSPKLSGLRGSTTDWSSRSNWFRGCVKVYIKYCGNCLGVSVCI